MAVYAKKGERITCEKGHPIGTFVRDVFVQEVISPASIAWEIEPHPQSGDPVAPCSCGANYMRMLRQGGLQAFIDGRWRAVWNG